MIGSSETIRKTTFHFNEYKKHLVSHKKSINQSFLEWFIGFVEGDGSFIVSKNRLFFILNQKEEKVLQNIRTNLGFGKVSTYKTLSRFIVADKTNIDRLIHLFNGNLVLTKTNNRFNLWLSERNSCFTKTEDQIEYLGKKQVTTFHDSNWLSGFIDAEGCFNVRRKKNLKCKIGFTVDLRFILDQKSEKPVLEKIKSFLQTGNVNRRRSVEEMYRLAVSHRQSHAILIHYLQKHPLRTIKKVSYLRFCRILSYLLDRTNYPLTEKGLRKLERLIQNIRMKS